MTVDCWKWKIGVINGIPNIFCFLAGGSGRAWWVSQLGHPPEGRGVCPRFITPLLPLCGGTGSLVYHTFITVYHSDQIRLKRQCRLNLFVYRITIVKIQNLVG